MDDEILEFFRWGQTSLPDDVIFYIAKHFLSPQECLYLALSRVSARFNELYGYNRQILEISRCYKVSLDPWQIFFQHYLFVPSLTVFNASSCYWLPASTLCHSISQMTSLVELHVQDTEICLIHFPKIFESCQKLLKLSLSLHENNLDQYEEGVMEKEAHGWLKKGFSNLTNLQVLSAQFSNCNKHCMEVWLVIFGVLKWCQNCIHLVIDLPFWSFWPYYSGPDENYLTITQQNQVNLATQIKLLPHLEWFRSLKTLAIFRHDHRFVWRENNDNLANHHGTVIKSLLNTFRNENCWPGESLERFWIELNPTHDSSENLMTFPIVKSLLLSHPNNAEMLHHDRFRHLEHLGGVDFLPFEDLPCLKYIQGRVRNTQAFNKFCELHPLLEHLHLMIDYWEIPDDDETPILFYGEWQLLSLKVLVFNGYYYWPLKNGEFEKRIFEACPNIQELYLGVDLDTDDSINFFSMLHLKQLTSLTLQSLSLPCGAILGDKIKEQCPKLKRLNLTGRYDKDHEASLGSGKHIPIIINLRDLRLRWYEIYLYQFPILLNDIASRSPLLERLVVHIDINSGWGCAEKKLITKLEVTIMKAVKKMKHLVLLCLVGFPMNSKVVRRVNRRLIRKVLPLRPALKFYLGETFPYVTDPTLPRIHCNEIIHPRNQFYAPPPISSSFSIFDR